MRYNQNTMLDFCRASAKTGFGHLSDTPLTFASLVRQMLCSRPLPACVHRAIPIVSENIEPFKLTVRSCQMSGAIAPARNAEAVVSYT
jgi:hypothetical protein